MVKWAGLVVFLAGALAGSACKKGSGGAGDGFARALEEAQPMFAKLRAVRDAVPPVAQLEPAECPPIDFGAVGDRPGSLLRLSWNQLVEITGGEKSTKTAADAQFGGFDSDSSGAIRGLHGPTAASWPYPNEETVRNAMREMEPYRFVAVLLPTKVEEASASSEGTLERGSADGWVVLVGLEDGKRLCQAPVHAESSDVVPYEIPIPAAVDPYLVSAVSAAPAHRAAQEDFRNQIQAAVDDAIARMTGEAR